MFCHDSKDAADTLHATASRQSLGYVKTRFNIILNVFTPLTAHKRPGSTYYSTLPNHRNFTNFQTNTMTCVTRVREACCILHSSPNHRKVSITWISSTQHFLSTTQNRKSHLPYHPNSTSTGSAPHLRHQAIFFCYYFGSSRFTSQLSRVVDLVW
jgi:hypothetical protein